MKMKKTLALIFTLALFGLFATGINSQQKVADTSRIDPRFDLRNISFFKNIRPGKNGLELNAVFELHNRTEKELNLKISALAYHQRDLTVSARRKIVEYPQWRNRDLDKEKVFIIRHDVIPEAKKEDIENADLYPESSFVPFHYFVSHVEKQKSGLEIKIRGIDTDRVDDLFDDNVFLMHEMLKTTINFKLRTRYTEQNIFFNYFGLVITDAETGKVVFTQLYYFDKPFRIR